MSTHTPGPWEYRPQKHDDWGVVRGPKLSDGSQPFVAKAFQYRYLEEDELNEHRRNKTDPVEADARLIAAAPDLLIVARNALVIFNVMAGAVGRDEMQKILGVDVIDRSEAAIAKATLTANRPNHE